MKPPLSSLCLPAKEAGIARTTRPLPKTHPAFSVSNSRKIRQNPRQIKPALDHFYDLECTLAQAKTIFVQAQGCELELTQKRIALDYLIEHRRFTDRAILTIEAEIYGPNAGRTGLFTHE